MDTSKHNTNFYDLLMMLNALSDLERDIVICLSHVYPRSISASQLARMIGVSIKARTLSRGVLTRLRDSGLILLDRLTPRLYSIRINHEHPILSLLVETCKQEGGELKNHFLEKLDETSGGEEQ